MEKIDILNEIHITSDYCVWYSPKNVVILADLHLGLEASLKEDGISLPRFQKDEILDRLSTILDKYNPETVIVNGDFKHEFGKNRREEFYEVMDVIDFIKDQVELIIIRGNHDNFLKTITEKKRIVFYEKYIELDNITITHGHEDFPDFDFLIMGHEHPSIKIRDDMGAFIKIPCYLFHKTKKILILPAFSPLSEGRDMISADSFISDNLKEIDIEDFHVYALTESGLMNFKTIKDIRQAYPDML
ncbi:MAG: metallophosphoesterase [Candidatus Saliniplasma sp.]